MIPTITFTTAQGGFAAQAAGELCLTTEYPAAPGLLTLTVADNGLLSPGDAVALTLPGEQVLFHGSVFSLRRGRLGLCEITAYDALRYLKNRDRVAVGNQTAGELLQQLAAQNGIPLGCVDTSGCKLPYRLESGRTLLDILATAMDETAARSGRHLQLCCEGAQVCLKEAEDLDIYIDARSAGAITATLSIENACNRVKLIYRAADGSDTAVVEQNEEKIKQWGLLQRYERCDAETSPRERARLLLREGVEPSLTVEVEEAAGDWRVCAGMRLGVETPGGYEYLLVKRARHVVRGGAHLMNLILGRR